MNTHQKRVNTASIRSDDLTLTKVQTQRGSMLVQAFAEEQSSIELVILKTRSGINRSLVDVVAAMVGLTDKEMARILNMSIRSLHSKRPAELLASDAAERLLLFQHLVQRGLAVFDANSSQFTDWLRTPLAELAISPRLPELGETVPQTRQMGRFEGPFDLNKRSEEDRVRTGQMPRPVPQTPLEVLDTVSGFRLVENVLGRIETGVFS